MRGTHNKLGEGETKVRLGQDSLPNSHFHSGNERKVGTLFYPHPLTRQVKQSTATVAVVDSFTVNLAGIFVNVNGNISLVCIGKSYDYSL